jgi:aspartyl-tRNA(Asn)/glutamyl-tRNA(Gln) amidotransferase subunit B
MCYNPAMGEYEAIIGMEVHAQLSTRSKMFCSCSAEAFGAEPNTHVCPVCLALPGALPVANRRAVEQTITVGLALNCQINETAVFSRKNYFYPDLPKGYQISMYDFPLCQHGWVEVESPDGAPKRIRIRRVHLEEDTAKSFHMIEQTLVDFNRAGLPLMEIVTEPDIRSPEEARQYLVGLRTALRYLGVSSADMEKGAMRCEANVSLRPVGSGEMGTKVEVKNLNSFRAVKQALTYEIERQTQVLDGGERVRQVTMGWDEARSRTVEQRAKEESEDYRYFPEPDLPRLHVVPTWVEDLRAALPEMPGVLQKRLVAEYGLSPIDASVLVDDRNVADYFVRTADAAVERAIPPQIVANWVTGDLFRLLKASEGQVSDLKITPAALAELIALVERKKITTSSGKLVLEEMAASGRPPAEIVQERRLTQISDEEVLDQIIEELIAAHPEEVATYRDGKETVLQWFMGQVMRATRGKADPQVVLSLLQEKLKQ